MKSWQGAIGASFGFVALVAGALLNFHLNRRRDAMLRRDDVLSVAAALYGEILILRNEAANVATAVARVYIDVGTGRNRLSKFDSHFLEAHTLSEPMLYKALAAKIGLLSPELIVLITAFHRNLQEARLWLPLLVDKEDRGYTYNPLHVLEPLRDAVQDVVPALRAIEGMIGIKVPAPNSIAMGETNSVIDIEREFWESSVASD